MNRQHSLYLGVFTAALAGLLLGACASHDSKKTEAAATAAPKTTGAKAAGYTTLINNAGETVYCVRRAPTGSNIARSTTCMTAQEWERARESDKETLNGIRDELHKEYIPPKF